MTLGASSNSYSDIEAFPSFPLPPSRPQTNDSQPPSTGDENKQSETADFPTPMTFDEIHNNISFREPSLNQFPMPGGAGLNHLPPAPSRPAAPRWSNTQSLSGDKEPKPGLVRRDSNASSRSSASRQPGLMGPPPAPASARPRRLSHMPAPSSSTTAAPGARPPRKSMGPGNLVLDTTNVGIPRRRPSLPSRKAPEKQPGNHQPAAQNATAPNDYLSTPRSQKSRSLQPPSRVFKDNLTIPSAGPETLLSTAPVPANSGPVGSAAPSSATKRLSMMPPHVTGLGARTISPTDARRMKRSSLMPGHHSLANGSVPQADSAHHHSRPRSSQSPSMIPRKSVTPSSSRTTPDNHRKSHNSTTSLSSNSNSNAARAPSGTMLNPRPSQNPPTSRLPTPKARLDSVPPPDEEEVPPVPAIPKAYESPKTDRATHVGTRKSSLPLEPTLSHDSPRTETDSNNSSAVVTPVTEQKQPVAPARTNPFLAEHKPRATRKSLQPLKLPPLNLLPISGQIANKIDSLKPKPVDNAVAPPTTPPPRHHVAKTPNTPMTASRATFGQGPDSTPLALETRSSSSNFAFRTSDPPSAIEDISSLSLDIPPKSGNISPYASSSLGKGSEFSFMHTFAKLNSPRSQTLHPTSHGADDSVSVRTDASDSELDNNGLAANQDKVKTLADKTHDQNKSDSMPPPKFPASATWNNFIHPHSSHGGVRTTYLHSRRRSTASNLDSPRNPSISSNNSAATSSENDLRPQRSAQSLLTPVQKILASSRASPTPKLLSQEEIGSRDDLAADEEMRKLGMKRKDFESAARSLDELRRRAGPKEKATPQLAIKTAKLNIYERGEIIDYREIYFCGTNRARKHVGDLTSSSANFGYDDDRGDYNIVIGDHLAYRYEVIDVLGKGSFGQVVRCIDHKTGGLVAVKIIRNKKRFHQQALIEVNLLKKLKEWVSFAPDSHVCADKT